jgi:serine/threonine-protein kinase
MRLKHSPPPPRSRVPGLDPRWEATILRCLERDPADRYASAAELLRALSGEAVSPGRRRRRRRLLAAAGVLAAALLAGALVWRGPGGPEPLSPPAARRSIAVLGFKNLSAPRCSARSWPPAPAEKAGRRCAWSRGKRSPA